MFIGLRVKCPLFLADFHETRIFKTDFQNILKYQVSWKSVHCEPSCCVRTDRHDETIRNIPYAPKKNPNNRSLFSDPHKTHKYTVWGQNVEYFNVKLAVHLVATGLEKKATFGLCSSSPTRSVLTSRNDLGAHSIPSQMLTTSPPQKLKRDIFAIRTYSRNLRTLRHREMSGD